jgi:threonine dehydratase
VFSPTFHKHVVVTPLTRYQGMLPKGSVLWLKDETQQIGRSFKFRAAIHRLLHEPTGSTVVTASTGNHGMGLATAASMLHQKIQVYVPAHVSDVKANALAQLGAQVEKIDGGYDECVHAALTFSEQTGAPFISSLDDPLVVEGHSSLFYELRDQLEKEEAAIDALFVPVGGGGLLAGCLKCYHDSTQRIVGVELACVPSMQIALKTGERVLLPPAKSCAEGMLVRQAGVLPLRLAKEYPFLAMETVTEEEIQSMQYKLWKHNSIRSEGSGAASVAAALRFLERSSERHCIAAVISGGNIDERTFQEALARFT